MNARQERWVMVELDRLIIREQIKGYFLGMFTAFAFWWAFM